MKERIHRSKAMSARGGRLRVLALAALVLSVVGVAAGIRWWPQVRQVALAAWHRIGPAESEADHEHGDEHDDEHAAAPAKKAADDDHDDDHDHPAEGRADAKHGDANEGRADATGHRHDEASTLALSKQAKQNIGMRLERVELKSFDRTISVPGMIVERPGWSILEVTAATTGVITRIHVLQGQAVRPGDPLFDIRLIHEDLLEKQTEFLRTVEELDVVRREVERLEKVAADGAIAGKSLLERRYDMQKLEATLRAQRQALLLHGLTSGQLDEIVAKRTLLQGLTTRVPDRDAKDHAAHGGWLQVQELKVSQGSHVTVSTVLCRLADYGDLYVEGKAFEQDIAAIQAAAGAGWKVSATSGAKKGDEIGGLKIAYLDNRVDPVARAFNFYVELPNKVLRENAAPDGRRFISWLFKPGQRLQIRVPVEKWTGRIVLPTEAVAQEGAEYYVFEANEDHFDRRSVHVEYRDQDWVVIANNGAICPGVMVAASAAHQMQMAMKSKSSPPPDPHAGHNH